MLNLDPDELEHFEQLATEWWDLDGPMSTLHHINPIRLDYIQKQVPLKNQKVLDIGCGAGILSEAMALHHAQVTGIDLSPQAIEVANNHQQSHLGSDNVIDYQVCSAQSLAAEQSNTFDLVTCLELLEHVPYPDQIVASAAQLCKPGGTIIFSTINRSLPAYLKTILAAEYWLKIIPKNTHHYQKFIKPSELAQWCRQSHLRMTDIAGLEYNPFTHKAWLTPKPHCNYLLTAKKLEAE